MAVPVHSWSITIAGVDKSSKIDKRSLKFDWSRGGRATLKFTMSDVQRATGFMVALDDVVVLVIDGTVVFDGMVVSRENQPVGGTTGGTRCVVTCADCSLVMDRITIDKDYTGRSVPILIATATSPTVIQTQTPHGWTTGTRVLISDMTGGSPNPNGDYWITVIDGDHFSIPVNLGAAAGGGAVRQVYATNEVLSDLCSTYMIANYNIWLDDNVQAGPLLPPMAWSGATFQTAITDIMNVVNWVSRVTNQDRGTGRFKMLQCFPIGQYQATFGLDGSNTNGPVQWTQTRQRFANRVIVNIGGTQKLTRVQTFAAQAGAANYVVDYPVSTAIEDVWPNELYVDGQPMGPISWYADPSFAWSWDPPNHQLVNTGGGYNPAPGQIITVNYTAQYPARAMAQDPIDVQPAPVGRGPWEYRVDYVQATEIAQGEAMAQSLLSQGNTEPRSCQVGTIAGFAFPGDTIPVQYPDRQIPLTTWIVDGVSFSLWGPALFYYEYTITESLTKNWVDDMKQLTAPATSTVASGTVAQMGSTAPPNTGGGGGGGTSVPAVIGETPAGSIDGVNQDFTTAGDYGTVLAVFLNGVRQSSPAHYKEHSPNRFTMTDPPLPGDVIKVDYGDTTGLPVGGGGGSAGYSGAGTPGYLTKWLDVREFGDSGVSEGTGYLAAAVAGTEVFRLTATEADIKLNALILGAAGDAVIMRDAPNAVGLRNATAPQVFRVYNTSSVSNTNFERGAVGWFSNSFEVRTEMQGSGAPRNLTLRVVDSASLYFSHTSVDRWYMGPTGSFCSAFDNVSDIGLSDTVGRPRDIWLGRNLNLGQDAMPLYPYTSNLGAIYRKYLTLYAAELWVETLVAQNTMATIGGRILVGPTNILTRDVGVNDTVIYVKYNNFLLYVPGVEWGSKLWLESSGKFEMMFVASSVAPTAESDGSFKYSVLRRQDGSPANQWFAGDAVMDTGKTGSGFIDLYSLRGIKSVNEAGPTIVGNLRLSGAYNDWRPRWAIGNLANLYGYGTTVFGVGLGDPTDANITIDAGGPATATQPATASQGFRIRQGSIVKLQAVGGSLFLTGELVVGTAGLARSGATDFAAGNGWFFDYNNGNPRFRVGNPQGQRIAWDGSGTLTVVGAITVVGAPASGMAYADFSNVVAGYAASNAVRGAANDSAAIGGMAASTVQSGVNRANTGLDGNGSLLTAARPTYGVGAVLAGAGLYLGSDVMGFYNGGAWVTYMDNGGGFYLHGNAGNALYWNGSTLQVIGAITATSGTFTGDVNVGTAGKLYCGMYTFGSGVGWLLEFNAGTPRFYCGNGGGNGVSWDGTNLQMRSNRVQITELGLKLYAAAARDLACSVYWDVGDTPGAQSSMGLFTQNVYNVERGITLENSSVQDYLNQSFTVRMNASIANSKHASIMCFVQTKTPQQDRIEFDCNSGAYRFLNLTSITGSPVVFGNIGGADSFIGVNASDERLKRKIAPFETGMAALRQIVPIVFEPREGGARTAGFSAQNVLPHVPAATPINPDGYYGFIDRAMIAVVVNALKELDARLAVLEG